MSFDRGTGLTGTGEASVLPIDKGGTGADTAAEARTNLNLGALFSDTSGNVGIGTSTVDTSVWNTGSRMLRMSSPNNYAVIKLDHNDTSALFLSSGRSDDTQAYVWASGVATNLNLGTNDTTRMVIDPSGNVGIGTTLPARPLHVSDVMRLEPRNGAPSSPDKGDIYFDSADNKLKCYDGTSWQNLF